MKETTTRPAESIAARIRRHAAEEPRSPMSDLSAQARRLRSSIAVLQKWEEAAMEDRGTELITLAEATHDQLEEEGARVAWEMGLGARTAQPRVPRRGA